MQVSVWWLNPLPQLQKQFYKSNKYTARFMSSTLWDSITECLLQILDRMWSQCKELSKFKQFHRAILGVTLFTHALNHAHQLQEHLSEVGIAWYYQMKLLELWALLHIRFVGSVATPPCSWVTAQELWHYSWATPKWSTHNRVPHRWS